MTSKLNRSRRTYGVIHAGALVLAGAGLLSGQTTVSNFSFDNYRLNSVEQGCSIRLCDPSTQSLRQKSLVSSR
jgi:hypothetical protein